MRFIINTTVGVGGMFEQRRRHRVRPSRSELGVEVSATAVAQRYQDLLDGYVLDRADAGEAAKLGIPVTAAHTLMTSLADREELARHVLASADALTKATA